MSDGIRFLGDSQLLLIKDFVVVGLSCLGAGAAKRAWPAAQAATMVR